MGAGGRGHPLQIAHIDAMIIVDKGHQRTQQLAIGAVERVRLPRRGFGDPAQRQPLGRLAAVVLQVGMRVVRAGVRHHQKFNLRLAWSSRRVQRRNGALEQRASVVGADEHRDRQRIRGDCRCTLDRPLAEHVVVLRAQMRCPRAIAASSPSASRPRRKGAVSMTCARWNSAWPVRPSRYSHFA